MPTEHTPHKPLKKANCEVKIAKAAGGRIKDVKAGVPNGPWIGWLGYHLNVFERHLKSYKAVAKEKPVPLPCLTIKPGIETATQKCFQTMETFPLRCLL